MTSAPKLGSLLLFSLLATPACNREASNSPLSADPSSTCQAYEPGRALPWDEYAATYNKAFNPFGPNSNPQQIYADWNTALDREMTPALYEVFTSPETKILYGSYSDANSRIALDEQGRPVLDEQGVPTANSFDVGQGLRVVWQLEKTAPVHRLISVITFWRFDTATGTPMLVGGFDTMRIRSQLTDFVSRPDDSDPVNHTQDPGQGFAAVSYQADLVNGQVSSLVPSPPLAFTYDPATSPPEMNPTVLGIALPVACAACHRGHYNRLSGAGAATAAQAEARDEYLQYVANLGVPSDAVASLRDKMSAPATMRQLFTPSGLISTLKAKCATPAD